MKHLGLLSIIYCFIILTSFGQDKILLDSAKDSDKIEQKYSVLKDSIAKYRQLIPAVSSIVINSGEIEIVFFSSLAYAGSFRNDLGNNDDLPFLQTYLQNGLQATYGIKSDRLNLGLDINTGLVDIDNNANNFPSSIFRKKEYPDISTGLTVTSIGPRMRWRPFLKNYNLVIQVSTWFPTYGKSDYSYLFGLEQVYANAQIFYNQPITKKLFLFSQIGMQYGINNKKSSNIYIFPFSLFLSYLATQKVIFFGFGNHVQIRSNESIFKNAGTTQLGLGTQYQHSKNYALNVYYAKEVGGKNYYSYDNISLSIRVLID
ncbi:transporter family protein [Algoriphagus antarcticus]|uniref:Uncharacterized protein n=1 Tax=Algoriphagus antarcticus TaxID=238540 RepID=A0A3E0E794_9BACT|nr:hypothetical protein [Algoriphagus antarcticus]REG92866.1 hypothetical protein C8N25_102269 [Algoriphagus antarcticus]